MPRTRSRARKKKGRLQPKGFGGRVERAGHTALTESWSLVVWLFVGSMRFVSEVLSRPLGWLREQRRAVQIATLALIAAAGLAAAHALGNRGPEPAPPTTETEALARVIRSEISTGTEQQKLHVAWATRNLATERGETIVEMACSPCGPQEAGRPVSTRQPATDPDRELARLVLDADARLDPTGGATHFINPALQDEMARRGVPGYSGRPYRRVRRVWNRSYGWAPYYRLGSDLELWGPARDGREDVSHR